MQDDIVDEESLEDLEEYDESDYDPSRVYKTHTIDVDVRTIRPLTIVPSPRKFALDSVFSESSGLSRDQFASNSWGFPPIPIPEWRTGNQIYRGAPKNVNQEFIGHPIYWIDPKLSDMMDGETREAWSIRMFYLILGFGYWSNPEDVARWIDYPKSKGVEHSFSDMQIYHQPGNPPCGYDRVGMLGKEDLKVPLSEIEEHTSLVIAAMKGSIEREMENYSQVQAESMQTALEILGYSQEPPADHPPYRTDDALWHSLRQDLVEVLSEFDSRIQRGQDYSGLIGRLETVMKDFSEALNGMEHLSGLLNLPFSHEGTSDEAYSKFVALLNMTVTQGEGRHSFDSQIKELFSTRSWQAYESADADSVVPTTEFYILVRDLYDSIEKSLVLSVFNNMRAGHGQPAFSDLDDMERFVQREKIREMDEFSRLELGG